MIRVNPDNIITGVGDMSKDDMMMGVGDLKGAKKRNT